MAGSVGLWKKQKGFSRSEWIPTRQHWERPVFSPEVLLAILVFPALSPPPSHTPPLPPHSVTRVHTEALLPLSLFLHNLEYNESSSICTHRSLSFARSFSLYPYLCLSLSLSLSLSLTGCNFCLAFQLISYQLMNASLLCQQPEHARRRRGGQPTSSRDWPGARGGPAPAEALIGEKRHQAHCKEAWQGEARNAPPTCSARFAKQQQQQNQTRSRPCKK